MDPISACGLASAIISFVDLSWKVTTGASQIYGSVDGVLAENAKLDVTTSELESVALELGRGCSGASVSELAIKALAKRCQQDSEAIFKILKELKVNEGRSLWKAMKASVKSIRRRNEIRDLNSRLQETRSEIILRLNMLLREEQSEIHNRIKLIQDESDILGSSVPGQISQLQTDLTTILKDLQSHADAKSDANQNLRQPSFHDVKRKIDSLESCMLTIPIQHRILRHIVFGEIGRRKSQIRKVTAETCAWVYQEEPARKTSKKSMEAGATLRTWLESDQPMLHISGKAGSGKSTLMKFLVQEYETLERLKRWAGQDSLIVADFYFWRAGSSLQKSLQGLYRTLLYEVLRNQPELIKDVFPIQLGKYSALPGDREIEAMDFDDEAILKGFNLLLQKTEGLKHRYCFFIDGLDEFEGKPIEHEKLVEQLNQWTQGGRIKICSSGRPHREYLDIISLYQHPMITLSEVNEHDIHSYCLNTFANDRKIKELNYSHWECFDLASKVSRNARGVFLWAHLVIDILLDAIRLDDLPEVLSTNLEKKLREIPPELDQLYSKLLTERSPSKSDRARADKMLLFAAKNPGEWRKPLSAVAFSWIDDPKGLSDPCFPPIFEGMTSYTEAQSKGRMKAVQQAVNTITRGFLEIRPLDLTSYFSKSSSFSHGVEFTHRSAHDYVMDNIEEFGAPEELSPLCQVDSVYRRAFLGEIIYGVCQQIHEDRWDYRLTSYLSDRNLLALEDGGAFFREVQVVISYLRTEGGGPPSKAMYQPVCPSGRYVLTQEVVSIFHMLYYKNCIKEKSQLLGAPTWAKTSKDLHFYFGRFITTLDDYIFTGDFGVFPKYFQREFMKMSSFEGSMNLYLTPGDPRTAQTCPFWMICFARLLFQPAVDFGKEAWDIATRIPMRETSLKPLLYGLERNNTVFIFRSRDPNAVPSEKDFEPGDILKLYENSKQEHNDLTNEEQLKQALLPYFGKYYGVPRGLEARRLLGDKARDTSDGWEYVVKWQNIVFGGGAPRYYGRVY